MRRGRKNPIITLTTDFGLTDFYVALMKAVLLRHCPNATVIDITHNIPQHDILCGSLTLEQAIAEFPQETIHLAVIDPGVGTDRRLIIAELNGSVVICPDNGLITWAWRLHHHGKLRELTWRPTTFSNTFHGRDIMAPVAGMIAGGKRLSSLGKLIDDPVLLDLAPATGNIGQIIHIDHFGNATTNMVPARPAKVIVRGKNLGSLRQSYGEVKVGQPLALIGSRGLVEIAVRNGSAAKMLKLSVGDKVELKP